MCTFQPGDVKAAAAKGSIEVDLLQDHPIYCLEAYMCALFSPGILQAVAVKGLSKGGRPCNETTWQMKQHGTLTSFGDRHADTVLAKQELVVERRADHLHLLPKLTGLRNVGGIFVAVIMPACAHQLEALFQDISCSMKYTMI